MTSRSHRDRTHESVINGALAQLLQERFGLSAAAETLREGSRPDIVVRLDQCAAVIETEVEPARTVEADALSRLGMMIDGQRVQNVYAVKIPSQLRAAGQLHLRERMLSATLQWQEWRSDGSSGPRQSGLISSLAEAVKLTAPPVNNLEDAVDLLDKGARQAGAKIYSSPGSIARVSRIFGAGPTDEAANMAALVIINAMVFQERLASSAEVFQPVGSARQNGAFSAGSLTRMWDAILDIDYYPIFSMARDIVQELSGFEAPGVLEACYETAEGLLGMGAVGRHDLAGRIFNQLVSERKLLAAFYTSIPVSVLLAVLALSPESWADVD